jgi:hypothetical protein
MSLTPQILDQMTRALLQNGPAAARMQQPRDPNERGEYITHLRREAIQRGGLEGALLRLALFGIGAGQAVDLHGALRSSTPALRNAAVQMLYLLSRADLLPASEGLKIDPEELGRSAGPHLLQDPDRHFQLLNKLFPAFKTTLAPLRSHRDGLLAARVFEIYRRHGCDDGSVSLLRQHLLAGQGRYADQPNALKALTEVLAEWADGGRAGADAAAVLVVDLLRHTLHGADEIDVSARLEGDAPDQIATASLLCALGKAQPPGAAETLRSAVAKLQRIDLRLRAAIELSRCQSQPAAELAALLPQALQPEQYRRIGALQQDLLKLRLVPLPLLLEAIDNDPRGELLQRLALWQGDAAEMAQKHTALLDRLAAALEPDGQHLSFVLSAIANATFEPADRPRLSALLQRALEIQAADPQRVALWQRQRLSELAMRHGVSDAAVLDGLEPWHAMAVHWEQQGITLVDAMDALVEAGAVEPLSPEQRDALRADEAKALASDEWLDNDPYFRLTRACGSRCQEIWLDRELIEEAHDEALTHLVAIARPPLPLSEARQGGHFSVLLLPAKPMPLELHDFGTDRKLQPLLQAGIPLYSDTETLQWVAYRIGQNTRRFLVRPNSRLDLDSLLQELNRLLQYLGRPDRYYCLDYGVYSEGKLLHVLCADSRHFPAVAERLRLPLRDIQPAAIPPQWLLLEPIRPLGEPVPPSGPRPDPWAPLWSGLS